MRERWRLATEDEVFDVVDRLRVEDIEECYAMMGMHPREMFILQGVQPETYVIRNAQGDNVALAGVVPDNGMGQVWMIATPLIERHALEFAKYSRPFLEATTSHYPLLYNWVHAANETHLRWLKWCGFTFIHKHESFGALGEPFYTFVRINKCV